MTMVTMVVAASTNDVIGKDGKLPWRLPEDLRHFKALTMGKPIVMGRKTYESIGHPLPGRRNIVMSRRAGLTIGGCDVVTSPDEALDQVAGKGVNELMVIGGERVYEAFLPRTGRIHMTRVHATIEGDAFFPELDPDEWQTMMSQPHPATEHQPLAFTFETIERRAKNGDEKWGQ